MTLKDTERTLLITNNKTKSQEAIAQVQLLIEHHQFSLAMNRIYYGVYYLLSALALKEGFSTTKHLQLIGWFNKTYVKTGLIDRKYGRWLHKTYENRMESDYNVLSIFTEEKVRKACGEMQTFIAELQKLL